MIELICVCGSTFKMIDSGPDVRLLAEIWLVHHDHCITVRTLSQVELSGVVPLTGQYEHINVFTGETL
jgi:hypothetical protein